MAIIYQTSFDHYTTVLQRLNAVSSINGGTATIGAFGRNSTNGLRLQILNNAGNNASISTSIAVGNPSTLYIGFAFKTDSFVNTLFTTESTFFYVSEIANTHLTFSTTNVGTIRVYRGATLLATTAFAMLLNTWYHFEFKITISTTVGVVEFKVNEVQQLNLTGINTQVGAIAEINSVSFYNGPAPSFLITSNHQYDDVVISNSGFTGDVQVRAFLPTGLGATNQWTPNTGTSVTATDESVPNDDTDYISTPTVNDLTLFTYGTIPSTSTIVAVVPIPYAKKTAAGTAKIKSTVRHGGVNYPGAEKAPSDSAYEYQPDVLAINPGTGVAFTPSDWNAPIEIGPQRSA